MTRATDSRRPCRTRGQLTFTALVLLASVGWAQQASAVFAAGSDMLDGNRGSADCRLPVDILVGPVVNPANNHRYYLLHNAPWPASEAQAICLGGHLVTINDEAEQDWVWSEFSRYGGVNRNIWTGLTDEALEGIELWKSAGTAAGTALVKDICAGDCGLGGGCGPFGGGCSFPQTVASIRGLLFFVLGDQLWRSDGTDLGTVRIGGDGLFAPVPDSFTVVNRTLFFTARDGATGVELWKSDGTAGGTVLVKDINPGPGDSNPTALTNVNGWLIFQACEPQSGCEVWRSDGTEDGTWQLDDIVPGAASSNPSGFTRSGSLLYFTAEEALDGRELWAIPVSALEPPPCVGNCDGTGGVTIDELITLVNIALGKAQGSACPHGVPSGAHVDVALIIQAVNVALTGCAT